MRVIHLTSNLPDVQVAALEGVLLQDDAYDLLLSREDADVYKPDGTVLLKVRTRCFPATVCAAAYNALRHKSILPGRNNRGTASGKEGQRLSGHVLKSGQVSKTTFSPTEAKSGIVGFYDRYIRFPYCRQTAYNLNHPELFAQSLPFIRAVDGVFRAQMSDRYAAQLAMIQQTHPDFYIHGTAFTTITVNKNWQTAVHQDAGDLRAGFGVLTAFRAGTYTGCYFTFPKYRVAVDLHTGDVLLCDVHEWHGNTPLIGIPGQYERLSCVFYYRENMVKCGSAAQELARAKRRTAGMPLYD